MMVGIAALGKLHVPVVIVKEGGRGVVEVVLKMEFALPPTDQPQPHLDNLSKSM